MVAGPGVAPGLAAYETAQAAGPSHPQYWRLDGELNPGHRIDNPAFWPLNYRGEDVAGPGVRPADVRIRTPEPGRGEVLPA